MTKKVNKKFKKAKKKKNGLTNWVSKTEFGVDEYPGERCMLQTTQGSEKVRITTRNGNRVVLRKHEAIELMGLFQKLYPLDALGQV